MNDPHQICLENFLGNHKSKITCQSFDDFLVSIIVFGGWYKNI